MRKHAALLYYRRTLPDFYLMVSTVRILRSGVALLRLERTVIVRVSLFA